MDPIAPYLENIRTKQRLLHAQRNLQSACNTLAPGDLTRLYLALDTPEFAWLAKDLRKSAPSWDYMTAPARRRAARGPQLVAQPVNGQVQLYETTGIERQNKRLFILFSGENGQFFIPLAMVMHLLPPGPKDVLVVRAKMGDFYVAGIDGLGASIGDIVATLKARYQTGGYRHVTVSGFSAGGSHAIQVAEVLRADLCVLLATRFPSPVKRLAAYSEMGVSAFNHVCDCTQSRAKRLVNVIASKFENDVHVSQKLKSIRPQLIEYHLFIPKEHNVLAWLCRTRMIRPFFLVVYGEKGVVLGLVAPVFAVIGLSFRGFRQLIGRQKRIGRVPRQTRAVSASGD